MAQDSVTSPSTYDQYPLDITSVIRVFVVGLLSGALAWLLYMALSAYVVQPVFCGNSDNFGLCANGGTIAWFSAAVLAIVGSTAALARMAVYRPLLVTLATFLTLWAAHAWLGQLVWYQALGWHALLFGLCFAVYAWVARATSFLLAIIVTVLLVVAARYVLLVS